MSSTLSIKNYGDLNILEKATLASDAAAAATTMTLQNVQNFTADSFFVVGILGSERSEMRKVVSVAGQVVTFTPALSFAHEAYEPVTKLFGDTHKVYRSTSQTGTFTSNGTIAIDVDQEDTLYTDVTGSSSYWYKRTYLNSVSSGETDLELAQAVRGNGYADYASVEVIREAAGFQNNRNISDVYVDKFRQAAQAEINGTLSARYTVPFSAPINAFIADITERLAGGKLWLDQYNQAYSPTGSDKGSVMVKSAKDDLALIRSGAITLIGEEGSEEPSGGSGGIGTDGWPDNTTETASAADNGAERGFRISDGQGYSSRKY